MQHDAQSSIGVLFVPPALVNFGDLTILVRQNDPTHPHCDVAFDKVCRRFGLAFAPPLDAKAAIKGIVRIVAYKIG